jgi:hypothetical protein
MYDVVIGSNSMHNLSTKCWFFKNWSRGHVRTHIHRGDISLSFCLRRESRLERQHSESDVNFKVVHVIARAVGYRILAVEAWVRAHFSPCGTYG